MNQRPKSEKPDLREKGSNDQASDRRLFMQLLAFGNSRDSHALIEALKAAPFPAVLYEDLHDPQGVALLTFNEETDFFVTELRAFLNDSPFSTLTQKPQFTMFGRTYSLGYEPDLEESLFNRPRNTALNPDWPWVVWYPLRRSGEFAQLPHEKTREILMEHGSIGRNFGEADLAHDIRLACYGLDQNDNDFVIGLLGSSLHPLSAIVQTMRKTIQTSLYIEKLGPFWVGKAVWQTPGNPGDPGASGNPGG
jgi:chlorite dismutase